MSVLLEGGDEIRSLSVAFCDEIITHQTVTFFVLKMSCEILWCLYTEVSQLGNIVLLLLLFVDSMCISGNA